MTNPVVLIILDGWGLAPAGPGNAVSQASVPNFNRFWASYPHAKLTASGEPVGLPHGERGNSETGHLNLGAGRIVYQDLPRINMSIADGSFFKNQAFLACFEHVKKNNSALHLMGLIGQGGVHSSNEHLYALLRLAKEAGLKNLFLQLFTDGRDSPPTSARLYLSQIETRLKEEGLGRIASLCGRYFALDRDNRWERTQKTYELLVDGLGEKAFSAEEAVQAAYDHGKTDEFIEPTLIVEKNGQPLGLVKDQDAVIFFNYRIDRPRQLTKAFILPDLEHIAITKPTFDPYAEKYFKKTYIEPSRLRKTFPRKKVLSDLFFVTMTEYEKGLPAKVAFPPISVNMTLSRVLSERNLRQLHITETEKERFVTYYFNGQLENRFEKEERIITPSPAVPTYDQKPEMSAYEQTETIIQKLSEGKYEFILINYANPDMVGHTGNIGPATKACETVDFCVGKIANWLLAYGGTLVITGDHGNAEEMINPKTGQIDTEHNGNPVPFIVIKKNFQGKNVEFPGGILADIAPTILSILGLKKPLGMTGRDLLVGSVLSD